jgi:hypothetical protein
LVIAVACIFAIPDTRINQRIGSRINYQTLENEKSTSNLSF